MRFEVIEVKYKVYANQSHTEDEYECGEIIKRPDGVYRFRQNDKDYLGQETIKVIYEKLMELNDEI